MPLLMGVQALQKLLLAKKYVFELDAVTVDPGASRNIDVKNEDGIYSGLVITCRCTYNSAATAGVRIRVLYSGDNVNFDSEEDADAEGNYFEPTFSAGATRQRTAVLSFLTRYARIRVTNLDTTYAVTVSLWRGLSK